MNNDLKDFRKITVIKRAATSQEDVPLTENEFIRYEVNYMRALMRRHDRHAKRIAIDLFSLTEQPAKV